MKKKMRCRSCMWFGWDFITGETGTGSFCGLHGRRPVDPDGDQVQMLNRDHDPDCGYAPNERQLELF